MNHSSDLTLWLGRQSTQDVVCVVDDSLRFVESGKCHSIKVWCFALGKLHIR